MAQKTNACGCVWDGPIQVLTCGEHSVAAKNLNRAQAQLTKLELELDQAVKDGNRLADALVKSREEVAALNLQNGELSKERDKWKALAQKYGEHALDEIHKVLSPMGGLCEEHKKTPSDVQIPCPLCANRLLDEARKEVKIWHDKIGHGPNVVCVFCHPEKPVGEKPRTPGFCKCGWYLGHAGECVEKRKEGS